MVGFNDHSVAGTSQKKYEAVGPQNLQHGSLQNPFPFPPNTLDVV